MDRFGKALKIFEENNGALRTSQAVSLGIHYETLYGLLKQGKLVQVSRGLYRLAALPELSEPDLVTVALRVPKAVICLVSALAYYGLTTQIPHEVTIALPKNTKSPHIDFPPIRVFYYGQASFKEGVEKHKIDDIEVSIYSPEKTIVDCFKFRNKIGLDVAIEALKLCIEKRKSRPIDFMQFARAAKVASIIKPYLQAIT
jgi:predicted transcriptional regulator of viral defense system